MVAFLAEAACGHRLLHGEVEVGVALVAEDAVHCALLRHPLGCVVVIRGADVGLFILVRAVAGGCGNLQHFELYF